MAERVSTPTLDLLLEEVREVDWFTLGIFLGLSASDIKEIEEGYSQPGRRRLEMLNKWMTREPNPTWEMIITALEKIPAPALVARLKGKYILCQRERPHATPLRTEESDKVIKLDRKTDTVARRFHEIDMEFGQLLLKTQSSLESKRVPLSDIKRLARHYTYLSGLPAVSSIDDLFDKLTPYCCFLNYPFLELTIHFFLQRTKLIRRLQQYEKHLKEFKCSTTLQQFMEIVEQTQKPPHPTAGEATMCTVTVRLVGGWLPKSVESLQKLMEEVFQGKSSVLTHLKIRPGSLIVIYLAPQSEAGSLTSLAREAVNFASLVGVCGLQVGRETLLVERPGTANFSFESCLLWASRENNQRVLSFLLYLNTNPNAATNHGWTALMVRSDKGYNKVVTLLLNANADPDCQADNGETALFKACKNGHSKVAHLLLKAKANPDLRRDDGATALFVAYWNRHSKLVSPLLRANADPNLPGFRGITVLLAASVDGDTEVVSLLLNARADPNLQRDNGATALIVASEVGRSAIVRLLLNANANPDLQAKDGTTALFMACQNNHSEVVSLLLKANANPYLQVVDGQTALYAASSDGLIEIVRLLLNANTNPNLPHRGVKALFMASQKGYAKVVSLLLKAKANPDHQRDDGTTALAMASNNGHTEVVSLLVGANADPNLQRDSGATALFMASQNGHLKIVRLLLGAGANPNLQRGDGETALHKASQDGFPQIVSLLLKADANPELQSRDGATAIMLASQNGYSNVVNRLLKGRANPIHQSTNGVTALFLASQNGHTEVVKLLLPAIGQMADEGRKAVNHQMQDGRTALMQAHPHPEVVQLLLRHGADTDVQKEDGWTALMFACQEGYLETVELLLASGADPSISNHGGVTAPMIASYFGHQDIVDLLQAMELSRSSLAQPSPSSPAQPVKRRPSSPGGIPHKEKPARSRKESYYSAVTRFQFSSSDERLAAGTA